MMLEAISGMTFTCTTCVVDEEISNILQSRHAAAYGGHFGGHRTAAKVLQSAYYWPSIFKDDYNFVKCCDK